jgi:hypothetical protein
MSLLREQMTEQQGPSPDGGPVMPRFDPRYMLGKGASMGGLEKAFALQGALNPQRKFTTVGNSLVDVTPGTDPRSVFTEPKEEKPTEIMRLMADRDKFPHVSPQYQTLDAAIKKATTHPQGVSVSYGSPVAGVDASGNQVFFQPAKGGGQPSIVPGITPPKSDKPLTEAQAKAATFASQMAAAERELGGVKFDQTKLAPQLEVGLAAGAGNLLVGQEAQRVRQAQEQWAESYLRFKTGAATTRDEVNRNIRTFFPQPGDGPQVVEQKSRMRAQAQQDLEIAATGKASGTTQPARRKYNPQTGKIE